MIFNTSVLVIRKKEIDIARFERVLVFQPKQKATNIHGLGFSEDERALGQSNS